MERKFVFVVLKKCIPHPAQHQTFGNFSGDFFKFVDNLQTGEILNLDVCLNDAKLMV